ncbi:MAG TPA: SRPBCC family protein [Microthrixaceae bacterium]|nr:SRPBCC family protein [Microthrixaceae bacterium]
MTVDLARRQTSVSRVIAASPQQLFDVLTDASLHAVIDGSGTVRGARGSERLTMGSKFGMEMKIGVPYRTSNVVVEFEPNRRIAWRHAVRHRWRFTLEEVEGGTEVTETFDWSTALVPKFIELAGYPARHEPNMERTLERLDSFVTNRTPAL